jgi:secreted Zn-dependent insulinase-like peptidase
MMEISAPELETDQVEPWFSVPYSLNVGEIETAEFADAKLNLPAVNPYLPSNLDLLPKDDEGISLVSDSSNLQIWLDSDVSFGTPRANSRIQLLLSNGLSSLEDAAYAELYRRLVNDSLSTTVYPAYLAGLGYSIGGNETGYTVSLNGYQDKQLNLLATVIEQLLHAELTDERFSTFKRGLIKDLRNAEKDKPYTQTLSALSTLLISSSWSPAALAEALLPLKLGELKTWRQNKLAKMAVIAGLHGNVSTKDAQALENLLKKTLPMAAVKKEKSTVADITEPLLLNMNVDHNDAALLIYVQDKDASFASRAKSGLAGQILRSAYFSSLRTDQQLGYVVSAGVRRLNTRSGNLFLVQSPKAGVKDLEQATLTFMQNYVDSWQDLSNEEFAQQKSGLISRLTESDKNLAQRSQKYWQNLQDENYDFDTNKQIAAAVEQLSKDQMGEFMQDILKRLKGNRILIFSPGKFGQAPNKGRLLEDTLALKKP